MTREGLARLEERVRAMVAGADGDVNAVMVSSSTMPSSPWAFPKATGIRVP